jgi:hypothetical protein
MLIATFLHWEKFSHGRPAFTAWLVLYMITPFLVPAVWLFNRRTDPRRPQSGQGFVSKPFRIAARSVGIIVLACAAAAFLDTDLIIRIWPWSLTALTARVLAGWQAVIGVSLLSLASDPRWTAWRAFLESLFLAHVFIFIAAAMKPGDFKVSPFNGYTIPAAIFMIALAVYYAVMERRRRFGSEK